MAINDSSLSDFEYRVIGIESLEGRVYNHYHDAKLAIINSTPLRNRAAIREVDLDSHIQIRLVSRGRWVDNIREVFGLE